MKVQHRERIAQIWHARRFTVRKELLRTSLSLRGKTKLDKILNSIFIKTLGNYIRYLINHTFLDISHKFIYCKLLQTKSILMHKNKNVYQINSKNLSIISKKTTQYFDSDEVIIGDNMQNRNYSLLLECQKLYTQWYTSILVRIEGWSSNNLNQKYN